MKLLASGADMDLALLVSCFELIGQNSYLRSISLFVFHIFVPARMQNALHISFESDFKLSGTERSIRHQVRSSSAIFKQKSITSFILNAFISQIIIIIILLFVSSSYIIISIIIITIIIIMLLLSLILEHTDSDSFLRTTYWGPAW